MAFQGCEEYHDDQMISLRRAMLHAIVLTGWLPNLRDCESRYPSHHSAEVVRGHCIAGFGVF
ncbi:hypothetical protein HBI56_158210 [Parastagonospora nodorum]|uniref:Uncharacterized protein n=1 Tax=Phaeosphaeria nodorum (strain SN15 / ATCC MYA-4574 / FGSC 10173) TaxID=321614 RepID=A0A7U2ETB1_PHANO|nr:hypothetical protein HBH56_188940 [Parastagonospora nodorum]QRC92287.1 hypothetical protein JI435_402180 [Parastagonospora nodorum SN15]KAH3925012.1 hypothetical protein HBH54_184750 [Parastagonospora nodorum]KAH3954148.1 hypothetical protein HBH53_024100 [Parastagonospora nodorum]KAH3963759.1 hypothetical protein HBH51_163930 [Parastagonospora nodorum]